MDRRLALAFGTANVIVAVVVGLGVFAGLPSRWLPVDCGAVGMIVLFVASGVGLVLNAPWAARMARVASTAALAIGLGLVLALALTASYLAGIYGPVGRGGALILTLVAALIVPYLVVFPASQLVWLGPRTRPEKKPS